MSLEGLDDPQARAEITAFWNSHFPIMLAVHSDYDYLAVRLTPEAFGTIVHGFAPEWEQPAPVGASFNVFLEAFAATAKAATPEWPLSLFL